MKVLVGIPEPKHGSFHPGGHDCILGRGTSQPIGASKGHPDISPKKTEGESSSSSSLRQDVFSRKTVGCLSFRVAQVDGVGFPRGIFST